jgi:hypothetical protein
VRARRVTTEDVKIWQMEDSVVVGGDPPIPAHVLVTAVILGVLAVYGISLGSLFHLDDYNLFLSPAVTSPSGWWHVWTPLQTRPLTYFTFWLNYQFGGQSPAGYHAVNLALHALAVWLLYSVLVRILGGTAAFISTCLFAFHPIQAEPVVYVFERATLLAMIFCLLTLRAWLDKRYWKAAGWFALALLSKEECVTFPLFLLMFRRAFLPAAGMLCLSIAAGCRVLLALRVLHISGAGAAAGIAPLDYFTTQGTVILRYFRLLIVPYGFTCDPDVPIVQAWCGWLSWAVILIAVAVFV